MDNHCLLLIETPDSSLSIGMGQLNSAYTQCFNKVHRNRRGLTLTGVPADA